MSPKQSVTIATVYKQPFSRLHQGSIMKFPQQRKLGLKLVCKACQLPLETKCFQLRTTECPKRPDGDCPDLDLERDVINWHCQLCEIRRDQSNYETSLSRYVLPCRHELENDQRCPEYEYHIYEETMPKQIMLNNGFNLGCSNHCYRELSPTTSSTTLLRSKISLKEIPAQDIWKYTDLHYEFLELQREVGTFEPTYLFPSIFLRFNREESFILPYQTFQKMVQTITQQIQELEAVLQQQETFSTSDISSPGTSNSSLTC